MNRGKKYYENQGYNCDNETNEIGGIELDHQEWKCVSKKENMSHLFKAIKEGNLDDVKNILQGTREYTNSCFYGGLTTPIHAACYLQKLEILNLLIANGAKIDALDNLGNSPLHVAVKEKWYAGMKALLDYGASPNQMSEPPLRIAGQRRETPLHAAVRTGEISSITLMLKKKPDLSIRDRNNYTIFHLAAATRNYHILKQLLMDSESRNILENMKHDIDSLYHAALSSTAAVNDEHQVLRVMQLIYKCNDDINVVNFHKETPIFLACQLGLPKVVKFLLDRGADASKVTEQHQTTVHAACQAGCSTTLKHLLQISQVKMLITTRDCNQRTPFYYAVISASVECCKTLIDNGEHLTNMGCEGVLNYELIMQKLPSAMELFRELFDSGVKISSNHQFHPDFTITFDYSVLMSSERDELQGSIASELYGTSTESLLKHPLLESFLCLKWARMRKYFVWTITYFFLYVLLHTFFVGLIYGSVEMDMQKNHGWYNAFKITHLVLVIGIVIMGIMISTANFRNIVLQWETYVAITAIITSVTVTFVTTDIFIERKAKSTLLSDNQNYTSNVTHHFHEFLFENSMASVSVLFVWLEFMMLLGRFPALGSYILMFSSVSKSLIKFIAAFLSLFIGLSMCFYVLFRNFKTNVFKTYALSFSKVILMMVGEIGLSELLDHDDYNPDQKGMDYPTCFYLVVINIFVFVMTVVTQNLLIGLAVDDIPKLKQLGKVSRLVKQATYLKAYETLLVFVYKTKFVPSRLKRYVLSSFSIKSVVNICPNKKKMHGKYFNLIPEDTLQEAINLHSCEAADDFQLPSDFGLHQQLKAFQRRFWNDRRTERHKTQDFMKEVNQLKSQVNEERVQLAENRSLLEKLLKQMENFNLKLEILSSQAGIEMN